MKVDDFFATLGLKVDDGSFSRGESKLGGLGKIVAAFSAYKIVSEIKTAVDSTIDLGGHLDDLRQKTGLSASSLQEYGYAAKLGGSSLDGFADATSHLARTLAEAKGGSKTAKAALADVHLTGAALTAAMSGPDGLDQALMEISGSFADLPDGPKKTALAMSIFGKSGADLIPTLNQGQQGLAELRREAQETGAVISDDGVSALDSLGDTIDKAKMSIAGLKAQAIVGLVPLIKDVVDGIMSWVRANRDVVRSGLGAVVEGLTYALRGFGVAVQGALTVLAFLSDHADVARSIVIALGAAFTAAGAKAALAWIEAEGPAALVVAGVAAVVYVLQKLADAFGVVATAVGVAAAGMLAFELTAAPIALVVGGVAALVAGIVLLVKNFDRVKDAAMRFWNWIKGIPSKIVAGFSAVGAGIRDAILGGLYEVRDWIEDFIAQIPSQIVDALTSIPGRVVHGLAGKLSATITSIYASNHAASAPVTQAFAPAAPASSSSSAVHVGAVNTTINVTGSGDPVAQAHETRRQFDAHMESVLRHAADTIGGTP